jgi:F-type H+-transporting ATPase subunit b
MILGEMLSVKRIFRFSLLALVIAGFVAVTVSIRAQDQSVPAQQQQTSEPAKKPGMPQQLVRAEREAAGEDKEEKDDKAVFRQSPSVQWIARKLGISTESASLLSVLLNFAVIGGILLWAARKSLPGIFRDRTAAIQKAMQEAQKASDEARRKLAEIESRLMKLDVEIGMMRDAAEREGTAEEARIQAAAQEDARKIVASAEQEIAAAAKAARRQLTAHAADLAVGLAQKQIRVDAATDQALVRNFAGQLGAESDSSDSRRKGGQ